MTSNIATGVGEGSIATITPVIPPPPGFRFGPNGELIPIADPTVNPLAGGSALPAGFTFGPTGEVIPVSPTNPGANPLVGGVIPADQPVTITQPVDGTPTTDGSPRVAVDFFDFHESQARGENVLPPIGSGVETGGGTTTTGVLPTGAPPTGLIGAEQALFAGGTGSIEALLGGFDVASGDILAGRDRGIAELTGAQETIAAGTEAGRESILAGGERGVTALRQGESRGMEILNRAFSQAVDPITGFIDAGKRAQTLQAALTGALGPEAQKAAIDNFIDDPSIKFQVERAERSLRRNASALGGIGSGNVRKALVREAVQRAQESFNKRVDQLGQIAARGLTAATSAGQLRGQQGIAGADLIGRTAESTAEIERGVGRDIGELIQSASFVSADVNAKAAEIERVTGVNLGILAESTGINVAGILTDLGSDSADLRSQAGRDIAAAIADTSSQLAGLQETQGTGISDVVGTAIANISNLLLQEGLLDSASDQQLATLLANLAVGEGTTAANISANIAAIETAGILGTNNAVQAGIEGLVEILSKEEEEK